MGRGLVSTRVLGQTDNNGNLSPLPASVFIVNKLSFVIHLVLVLPRFSNFVQFHWSPILILLNPTSDILEVSFVFLSPRAITIENSTSTPIKQSSRIYF